MKGRYIPFSDGFGFVGYSYVCPNCNHETPLVDCEEGCDWCGFTEEYVDPDDWYDKEMNKPIEKRAWNFGK